MKNLLFLLLVISGAVWGQQKEITVSGKVTDGTSTIEDVNVTVRDSDGGTKTDKNGFFQITVDQGAILNFSHIGFDNIEIVADHMKNTLNIVMVSKINELENVTVAKNKSRKTQKDLFNEYNDNPNLIKTKFGILNKETSGTALYIMDGEKANKAELNILEVISNSFPNVRISPRGDQFVQTSPQDPNAVIYVRGVTALAPAVYEVDGTLYTEPPLFLDVNQIDRIAFKPGTTGNVIYGTVANGGLFIINTKTGNFSPKKGKDNFKRDGARNDVILVDKPIKQKQVLKNAPSYLLEISNAKTKSDALLVHSKFYDRYSNNLDYILDVTHYFLRTWKDVAVADSLISAHSYMFKEDVSSLTSLAYIYEAEDYFEKANEIYKKILKMEPEKMESYMNLANSYFDLGQSKKAISIYARYEYLIDNGILNLNKELHQIFKNDKETFLIKINNQNTISNREDNQFLKKKEANNLRLVFQYNNKKSNFTLQFVNPTNNPFEIEYTPLSNDSADFNVEEPSTTSEFLIDQSIIGLWQVNATYFGNKSLTPTYLKATIYHNYGSASQRKEAKVFKLSLRNINQQLFTVSNMASVVSN